MKGGYENLESNNRGLIEKATQLKGGEVKFWVRRNITDTTTGRKSPDKLEYGWKIINIDANGLATMYSVNSNIIFHIPIKELAEINQTIFDSIE